MKRKLIFALFVTLFLVQNIVAQIDTSNIYPLEVGNFWEYKGGGRHYYEKVIGSETMSNGKKYKILQRVDLNDNHTINLFRRVENNKKVYYYNELNGLESKIYDVSLPKKSTWVFIDNTYSYIENITNEYYALIQDTARIYYMSLIKIDSTFIPPDTNWMHLYDDFAIGIGPILIGDITGYWTLRGAIINGVIYGSITVGVEEDIHILENNSIGIVSYPNPFNSSCKIQINVPMSQEIELTLFNILGEELLTIYEGGLESGIQTINLEMPKYFNSGIYFGVLKTMEGNVTTKLIYLK